MAFHLVAFGVSCCLCLIMVWGSWVSVLLLPLCLLEILNACWEFSMLVGNCFSPLFASLFSSLWITQKLSHKDSHSGNTLLCSTQSSRIIKTCLNRNTGQTPHLLSTVPPHAATHAISCISVLICQSILSMCTQKSVPRLKWFDGDETKIADELMSSSHHSLHYQNTSLYRVLRFFSDKKSAKEMKLTRHNKIDCSCTGNPSSVRGKEKQIQLTSVRWYEQLLL